MKFRIIYCRIAKFSYLKLNRGSDCIFISSLTIGIAIRILFWKFLSFVSVECGNKINSTEDEFNSSLLNDKILFVKKLTKL